jgi:hypothetical protein
MTMDDDGRRPAPARRIFVACHRHHRSATALDLAIAKRGALSHSGRWPSGDASLSGD